MKQELIFKNSIRLSFAVAVYATITTLLLAGIGFLGEYLSAGKVHKNTEIILIVFECIIAFIWFAFIISILFSCKIIIDKNEIKAKRFGKVIWSLKKEDISLCIYNRLNWWAFLLPVSSINAGALQFKLQNGKISRHYCSLSQKQVNKIKLNYDYPFKEIQTIYEQ